METNIKYLVLKIEKLPPEIKKISFLVPQPDCIVRVCNYACLHLQLLFFLFYSNSLKTNEKILSRRLIDGKNFNKSARTIFLSKYVFPRKCKKRRPETHSRTFQFFFEPTSFSPGFLVLLPLLVGVSPNTNAQTGTRPSS